MELKKGLETIKELLRDVSPGTNIIISIGCNSSDESWQENIGAYGSESNLIINIDEYFSGPMFKKEGEKDFENELIVKKYIGMRFDDETGAALTPLVKSVLDKKQNKIIICDFRRGLPYEDVLSIMRSNINEYQDPESEQGNLIFLLGYFSSFHLVSWRTKSGIMRDSGLKHAELMKTPFGELMNLLPLLPKKLEEVKTLYVEQIKNYESTKDGKILFSDELKEFNVLKPSFNFAVREQRHRNILHFKATLDFLTGGEKRLEVDGAIAEMKNAYLAYNDALPTGVGRGDLINNLETKRDEVTRLAADCQNLLNESEDPSKSTLQKILTGIMNVFKATGDVTMYLEGKKLLAEVRLAESGSKYSLKKLGSYLLKMVIQLTQYLLNATVKFRALVQNTQIEHDITYRDLFFGRKQRLKP